MKTEKIIRKYLEKQKIVRLSETPVSEKLRVSIVIPCYNEPEIENTLKSLYNCRFERISAEIIIVINSYRISRNEILEINKKSFRTCTTFTSSHPREDIRLIPVLIEDLPGKQTGAGLPRKIGMDLALERMSSIGLCKGIIVSLDADCTVENNYISEIYRQFEKYKLKSATIEFHHRTKGTDPNDPIKKAAEQYEMYLRYFRCALEFCGYPYPYYTIGSAFALTAETYARAGGMGKEQAGEDFYFLQRVFPLGKTRFIDTTKVFPSARISDRVPFGTGPEIAKMVKSGDSIKKTYKIEAFEELKSLFSKVKEFSGASKKTVEGIIHTLPSEIRIFIDKDGFIDKIEEINEHTATPEAFEKRFFNYFNGLKIIKFLHSVHPDPFVPDEVEKEYTALKKRMVST